MSRSFAEPPASARRSGASSAANAADGFPWARRTRARLAGRSNRSALRAAAATFPWCSSTITSAAATSGIASPKRSRRAASAASASRAAAPAASKRASLTRASSTRLAAVAHALDLGRQLGALLPVLQRGVEVVPFVGYPCQAQVRFVVVHARRVCNDSEDAPVSLRGGRELVFVFLHPGLAGGSRHGKGGVSGHQPEGQDLGESPLGAGCIPLEPAGITPGQGVERAKHLVVGTQQLQGAQVVGTHDVHPVLAGRHHGPQDGHASFEITGRAPINPSVQRRFRGPQPVLDAIRSA